MIEPTRSIRHGDTTCALYLGRGVFDRIDEITSRWPNRLAIVGDGFFRIYRSRLAAALGGAIATIVIPDGEAAKNLSGVEAIVTRLLDHNAKRDTTIIAVGGGVTGDSVGFAAAVFLRGVRVIHVPTTLLAQVDSSIGGKTAVNHPVGKNLIGAFHPPVAVISDVAVLSTLPRHELLSGVYEALKSGVIGDAALFELCEGECDRLLAANEDVLERLVMQSIAVKAKIVERDERENDVRKLLNYGHTIGHGIEAALGYRGLTHGEAVAWGMIGANEIAVGRGILGTADRDRINRAILAFKPTPPRKLDRDAVFSALRHDKKFSASSMVMVLPERIGRCTVVEGVDEREVRAGIEAVARCL